MKLIQGGQGHTDKETHAAAVTFGLCLLLLVALVFVSMIPGCACDARGELHDTFTGNR